MHWITNFFGQQWHPTEYNCWSFVADVYDRILALSLIISEPIDAGNKLGVAREIRIAASCGDWIEMEIPDEFDVVLMGRSTTGTHVGVWTNADGGRIVHCEEGQGVGSMTLKRAQDLGYKLIKFYRYADYSRN